MGRPAPPGGGSRGLAMSDVYVSQIHNTDQLQAQINAALGNIYTDIDTKATAGPIGSSGLTQATNRLLGRTTAGTGAVEQITVGAGLTLAAGVLSSSAGAILAQTEIDFGATPLAESTFTIIDANVSPSSLITAQLAYEAPTGKDLDELEMDQLYMIAGPDSGQFSLFVRTLDGSYLAGAFKINYFVG